MYLALLGFGMIVVFMALIMAKKLSPFTSLILIPIVFGLLAGYGWDTLEYAANGIINVASTFAMMTFAILYFGVMLTAGMFDPMVDAVVSWCKGDPLKVLVGTSVLAAFVSLDGDGTTTVMICCTAMLPIYERLHIKKIYLATLIILQNCIMNLIPWGGPTARVMSVMNLDAGEILAPLVPGMILGALYSVGVGYYLGLKERKRLGVTKNVEIEVAKVQLSAEEQSWKRPKMIFVNLLLTAAIIVALVMGLASSEILFGVGTAIALLVNYPNQKTQRQVISSVAPDMINVVMMVLGAGVLMGVLDGPEGAGMSNAIAEFLVSIIPESLGNYFAVIIAFISAPGTYLLNNDAFYYGVLPPLAATAQAYGFTDLQIGFAALMGQAFVCSVEEQSLVRKYRALATPGRQTLHAVADALGAYQAELEAALKAGKFIFHNVNGDVRVLEDINTLLTLSDTKGEIFQSNQTIRVCDQIANDVAVLFGQKYLGTVPNDASGRSSLWGDITKLIQQLDDIRAVENFDPEIVTCEQGDSKKAVLCIVNGLNVVNAMAQLYMSVIIQ